MARGDSRNDVPRRTGGERIHELPLTPAEGYLLSQIDGRTSVGDLELIVGLPTDELYRTLDRLVELRLVEIGSPPVTGREATRAAVAPPPERPSPRPAEPGPRAAPARPSPAPSRAAPALRPGQHTPRPAPQAAREPAAGAVPPTTPSTLPAAGTLTAEERKQVDTFLMRAESVDFYRLLGVTRKAERAEIRSAYFGLAKVYHPDAYYGREIGDVRQKLERIFRQITRAYEVLSRSKSRQQYDDYIKGQAILQGVEEEEQAAQETVRRHTLYGAKATAARDAAQEAATQEAATQAARAEATPSPGTPPPTEPPPDREPAPWPIAPPPAASLSSPAEQAIETPPAASPAAPRPADDWRRQRMARQLAAAVGMNRPRPKDERRGGDYLAEAETAAKDEEWGRVFGLIEAAEKLGLTEVERTRAAELRAAAGKELTRISLSQARFSESTGDAGAAFQHAENACRYGPEQAECWDTIARLGLRLGRELHRARDAAAKAIQLSPSTIAYRLTMIRVYLAAGLPKNARREAEAALALKPNDPQAKALLTEARAQGE